MNQTPSQDTSLRESLVGLLRGGHAHLDFEKAIDGIPPDLRGAHAPSLPHTLWQLLEHLRITQWDILEFSRNPGYKSPQWPDGYWPQTAAPPDDAAWERSVESFRQDRKALEDLACAPGTDLFFRVPWGTSTIFSLILLAADHNAYHVGQIVSVRHALGAWQPAALP